MCDDLTFDAHALNNKRNTVLVQRKPRWREISNMFRIVQELLQVLTINPETWYACDTQP